MRLAIFVICLALFARAHAISATNSLPDNAAPLPAASVSGDASHFQLREQMRAKCINERRCLCGRIVKMLPDALIIESGYTNLMRAPLEVSWLVPGTVSASRPANLVESSEPGSVCVGLVSLTEFPKSRRLKPKLYDYVIIQGYPAGEYTYTSVGTVSHTVRRYSASLSAAINLDLPSVSSAKTVDTSK